MRGSRLSVLTIAGVAMDCGVLTWPFHEKVSFGNEGFKMAAEGAIVWGVRGVKLGLR